MAQEKKSFEALDIRGLMRVLQFAMMAMGEELRKYQINLVLDKTYGNDTVDYPASFNPLRYVGREDREDTRKQRYLELMAFAKHVQAMLDQVKEAETEQWAAGVMEYFNSAEYKQKFTKAKPKT